MQLNIAVKPFINVLRAYVIGYVTLCPHSRYPRVVQ